MACYKRILNELNNKIPLKLFDLHLNHLFSFVELNTDIISKEIGVINNKTNQIVLQIIIPSNYPFKSPDVYVADDSFTNNNVKNITFISNLSNLSIYPSLWISSTIKYSVWSVSIINKHSYYTPQKFRPYCDLFSAWIFCVIRRPLLLHYWRGNIPNIKDCLCCESILCNNTWSPSLMMSDILAEYVTRRDFKINCGLLMQRWICSIFNNDRWIIPDDVILEIVRKLSP